MLLTGYFFSKLLTLLSGVYYITYISVLNACLTLPIGQKSHIGEEELSGCSGKGKLGPT